MTGSNIVVMHSTIAYSCLLEGLRYLPHAVQRSILLDEVLHVRATSTAVCLQHETKANRDLRKMHLSSGEGRNTQRRYISHKEA